jgi:Zn-dependent peptidase ImmA (M78 family)/transcriptional regulator with XRE-family HTH domain
MSLSSVIGDRVRTARNRLGLSQEQLADRAGFGHHQIVSQIELGQREVKAVELLRLARALHLSVGELVDTAEPRPALVLWRARPENDAAVREAEFLAVWQRYKSARAALRQPDQGPRLPVEKVDLVAMDYARTAGLADTVSRLLDLGSCPAASLQEVLEGRFGTLVWHADLGQDGSAACTRDEQGCAILINAREAPWRRNYDLAHELFHLVTWGSTDPETLQADGALYSSVEKQANSFASNLLLPADAVIQQLDSHCVNGQISWADLIGIAREFHVSTDALLWRLVNLKRFDRDSVQALLQNSDFKAQDGAGRRGAWSDPPPFSDSYVMAGFLAYTEGRMSRTRLAEYLEVSLIDLGGALEQYGLSEGDYYSNVVRTC